jgi:hypothetical protein
MHRFRFVAVVILASLFSSVQAEEPFLKKGDVIALVGGEDMVAASEYGYLELLLTQALPDYHLKFRNLAWEGDTVFEQPRQLNFPTWEQQLEKIGATVVICQFGQMESLAGTEKLPEFIASYQKFLDQMKGGGKRKLVIVPPTHVEPKTAWSNRRPPEVTKRLLAMRANAQLYANATSKLNDDAGTGAAYGGSDITATRDGLHCNETWALLEAKNVASRLVDHESLDIDDRGFSRVKEAYQPLLKEIVAKNRFWFDYWRPQNWAFLNGDRITQPSSRDHRDPNVRWFPTEMEQFLPLIAAKEEEIWKLASELK